jgi:hypothetical protein
MTKARRTLALIICALIVCSATTSIAKDNEDLEEMVDAVSASEGSEGFDSDQGEAEKKKEVATVAFGDRFGPSWDGRENYSDDLVNEFSILGGNYLGENWKNTYYVGGQYLFHLNDLFAFGAQYIYSPIVVDKDTPFYASLATEDTHIATALCQLNTPAAWRAGKGIYNMDFYFTLGMGAMQINRMWEPVGVIGGGARFYFPVPWIAFRLDINSYIHMTPLGGRSDLSGDVAMGGAISFMFPSKKRKDLKKD